MEVASNSSRVEIRLSPSSRVFSSKMNSIRLFQRASRINGQAKALRCFSTSDGAVPSHPFLVAPSPSTLTTQQVVGHVESVHLYLDCGAPGVMLDELRSRHSDPSLAEPPSLGRRWREMSHVHVMLQMHLLIALGFPPDETGLATSAQAMQRTMSEMGMQSEELKHIQKCHKDTWNVLTQRTFGVRLVDDMDVDRARKIAIEYASALMSEDSMKRVDEIKKNPASISTPEGYADQLTDHVLIPAMREVMASVGYDDVSDEGWISVNGAFQAHQSDDRVVLSVVQGLEALGRRLQA